MRPTGVWMPMYWADYFSETLHLTTIEHGAYLLLIGAYWRRGEALPDDDKFLARVTKTDHGGGAGWGHVRKTLQPMFEVRDGFWIHKRVEYEILKSIARSTAGQRGGNASATARQQVTVTVTDIKKVSKKEIDICAVARATRTSIENGFQELKTVYPKRDGANPWKPAEKLFVSAVRSGVDPQIIISSARVYAEQCNRKGLINTDKVAQCLTWLRQERWKDYAESTEDRKKLAESYALAADLGWVWDGNQYVKTVEGAV